jgi:hypothetical protein
MVQFLMILCFLWSTVAFAETPNSVPVSLVADTYVYANLQVSEQLCDQQVAFRALSDTEYAKKGDILVGKISKVYVATATARIEFTKRNRKYSVMSADGTMGAQGYIFADGRLIAKAVVEPVTRKLASGPDESDPVIVPPSRKPTMPRGPIFFLPRGLQFTLVRIK